MQKSDGYASFSPWQCGAGGGSGVDIMSLFQSQSLEYVSLENRKKIESNLLLYTLFFQSAEGDSQFFKKFNKCQFNFCPMPGSFLRNMIFSSLILTCRVAGIVKSEGSKN